VAVIIPPGYGLAALRWALTADPEEMITTIGVDLGPAEGDFVEAANNVARAWGSQFPAAQLDTDWTWRGVRLYVGEDGGASIPYDSVGFTITGTSAGVGPVQNTAILVKKATARAGRKGRGRMYVPPFGLSSAGYAPNGTLGSSTITDYQTRFTALRTIMANGESGLTFAVPPVLLHADGSLPDAVTAFTVQAVLATQRRRLRH